MAARHFVTRAIARKKMQAYPEHWVFETLSDIYHRNATLFGDREAFSCGEERLTWREANVQATALAAALHRRGFVRGDVLVIWLPSSIPSFLLRTACDRAGVVFCTPAMALGEAEITAAVKQTGAKGIVFPARWREKEYAPFIDRLRREVPHLQHAFAHGRAAGRGRSEYGDVDDLRREAPDLDSVTKMHGFASDESVMISLTGGTTGAPKLVETSHGARLTAYHLMCGERLHASHTDVVGAIYHNPHGPMSQTFQGAALFGAKVAILDADRFEPEDALRFLAREKRRSRGFRWSPRCSGGSSRRPGSGSSSRRTTSLRSGSS
jgi:non-ribosomal peptide synthetase component E (peptide arylation enzyme)